MSYNWKCCSFYPNNFDASALYDEEKKLVIRKVYDLIPSNMENKKKRIVVKKIEGKAGHKQFSDYADEFEFLTN